MEPTMNSAESFWTKVRNYMEEQAEAIVDEVTVEMFMDFLRFVRDEVAVDDERYEFDEAMETVLNDDWENDYDNDLDLLD